MEEDIKKILLELNHEKIGTNTALARIMEVINYHSYSPTFLTAENNEQKNADWRRDNISKNKS